MARKLSDADVARIRELAGEGRDNGEIAAEFDVTPRHIGRLVRMDQRATIATSDGPVVAAVDRFLAGLEFDDEDLVLAAAATVLATKLDACRASDSAAAAAAAPPLVREIRDTLRGLAGEHDVVQANVSVMVKEMLGPLLQERGA